MLSAAPAAAESMSWASARGKKGGNADQCDVCSTQKSPLRAGGCLAKSKRALSQAEAGNYVLHFSGLPKKAVSRQTF